MQLTRFSFTCRTISNFYSRAYIKLLFFYDFVTDKYSNCTNVVKGLPNYRRYRDPEANLVRPEEPEDVPMEDRNLAGDGNSNSDDFSNDSAGSDYSENYYTGSEH